MCAYASVLYVCMHACMYAFAYLCMYGCMNKKFINAYIHIKHHAPMRQIHESLLSYILRLD